MTTILDQALSRFYNINTRKENARNFCHNRYCIVGIGKVNIAHMEDPLNLIDNHAAFVLTNFVINPGSNPARVNGKRELLV
jgi:hypothetical protein